MKFFFRANILALLLTFVHFSSSAQSSKFTENKGKLYILYGWNTAYYTKSDIRFTGNNYDFEILQGKATDNQTPFSWDVYFNPSTMSIPQTNLRIGYFISDKINVAIGVDHMKYYLTSMQTVKINGYISKSGTPYDGNYNNDDIVLTPDFLSFEHTDGLNYINMEVSTVEDILSWTGFSNKNLQVYFTGGAGAGILLPKTNSRLLGMSRHDDFNVAGYGLSLKGGLNVTIFRYFFIQSEIKGGYINMPNIRTTDDVSDSASQQFFYVQPNFLFGVIFNIANMH